MTLSVWEPWKTMDRFDRIFDGFLGADRLQDSPCEGAWRPAADTIADDDGYTIRIDLPGVEKKAIDVSVEEGVLTVSAERSEQTEEEKAGRFYRRETRYGRFQRAFRLPTDADADSVTAGYEDGVLEVRIARSAAAKPRKITVGHA